MARTKRQIESEIQEAIGGREPAMFWPGGGGGGGSLRRRASTPVVRPHAKTSPGCSLCQRLHTTAEHARHGNPTTKSAIKPRKKKTMKAGKKRTQKAKKAKAKANNKAGSRKAKTKTRSSGLAELSRANLAPASLLDAVIDAVESMPPSGRYGHKVFISAIGNRVAHKFGMTLPQFKDWLLEQNRLGNLILARADLVGAMDPRLVRESEIEDRGATFHFVVDKAAMTRQGWSWK